MSIFLEWPPVHPRERPFRLTPHPDRDRLFAEHLRLFFWLGRRWFCYAAPFDRRGLSPEDVAAEVMLVAVRRYERWPHDRCSFAEWVRQLARKQAHELRQKASQLKRARTTHGQFAGDGFDTFTVTEDERQLEPWELLAECED